MSSVARQYPLVESIRVAGRGNLSCSGGFGGEIRDQQGDVVVLVPSEAVE